MNVQHTHHAHPELGRQVQCRLSFSIAPKDRRRGNPIQISEAGLKAHADQPAVAQKYAVMGCVHKLQEMGYTLTSFSALLMKAKSMNMENKVAEVAASMARMNRNDVVMLFYHLAYI